MRRLSSSPRHWRSSRHRSRVIRFTGSNASAPFRRRTVFARRAGGFDVAGEDPTADRKAAGVIPVYAVKPRVARVALPCAHVGPDAGPKNWHYCEHPDEPLGAIVCACKGCGPCCPGYATAGG